MLKTNSIYNNQLNIHMKKDLFSIFVILSFIFSFFIFIYGVKLNNLFLPWSYGGDAISVYQLSQNIKDSGWIINNSRLAAPFTGDFHDYAQFFTQNISYFFVKLFFHISKNIYFSLNLCFLLNCFACSLFSYYVFKVLKINRLISIFSSITFSLMPYYFLRGVNHFPLSQYQFIPFSFILCIWCYTEDDFFILKSNFFKNYKSIFAIIFCFLIAGNGGGYYPFFTSFFIIVTGLLKSNFRINKSILPSLFIVLIIIFFFVLNISPYIFYRFANGKNLHITNRLSFESEYYGLKIIQLFIPNNSHKINFIQNIINNYNNSGFLINENQTSYLGLIGSFGCLFLFLIVFSKKIKLFNNKIFILLSKLNLAGILFATIGGFSSLFSLLITSIIRGYNRISIFLSFLCILTISLIFNKLLENIKKTIYKIFTLFIISIFFIIGLFFQYPFDLSRKALIDIISRYENSLTSDKEFIMYIENIMPKEAMIYQLPYQSFPESGPINHMSDYRHFIGCINSEKLKWSYGTIKGRYPDYWHQKINSYPIMQKIIILSLVGFNGIYIDRLAYTSNEITNLEYSLQEILKTPIIYSKDNMLSFFDMKDFNNKIYSNYTKLELSNIKDQIISNIDNYNFQINNYNFPIEYNREYYFRSYNPENIYLVDGFSYPEDDHTWTIKDTAEINFPIFKTKNDIRLTIIGHKLSPIQNFNVIINDTIYNELLDGESEFIIKANELFEQNNINIKLITSKLYTPKELGINNDSRTLGFCLQSISIYEVFDNEQ